MTAKDYETPEDSGSNNTYVVQVTATDAALNATNQTITVTVTDVADYAVNMIDFDGSSYLSKTVNPGIADGTDGVLSFWLELDAADGAASNILDVVADTVQVARTTLNTLALTILSTGFSTLVTTQIAGITASDGRMHVAFSWSLVGGTPIFQAYINGVSVDPAFSSGPTAGTVAYSRPFNVSYIGAVGGAQFNGRLGDLFFETTFLDLSVPANLAKLISGGEAVYMGDTAQLPTGSQAKIAFSGNAAHWQAGNGRGSVQGWTATGTLTDAP
jgi:hypothetical protein